MTLRELMEVAKKNNVHMRVFVGCMTYFNGNIAKIRYVEWQKLRPFLYYKVLDSRTINGVLVVTL